MSHKKRVAVIFGGQSSEHEVSRVSAESVVKNINKDKYNVVMIGITKDGKWLTYDGPVDKLGSGEWQKIAQENITPCGKGVYPVRVATQSAVGQKNCSDISTANGDKACEAESNSVKNVLTVEGNNEDCKIDVFFPVLHGCNGEDGTIQGLFELAGIPYVGCGVLGSALGMDKAYSKMIFEKEGIPQGKYLVFSRKQISKDVDWIVGEIEAQLAYPCFVKPSNAGSSVGVGKANTRAELIKALENAAIYDRRVLVEEFINGREIECAVLGNDEPVASVLGEIIPCNEFYDYQAKYIDNGSKSEIPANIPKDISDKIREYAVRAFKALDCAGLSRVDFFVHKETGDIYINEINTLPGFTSISMYPKLWEASGVPCGELIDRLIDLAIERHQDNKREVNT